VADALRTSDVTEAEADTVGTTGVGGDAENDPVTGNPPAPGTTYSGAPLLLVGFPGDTLSDEALTLSAIDAAAASRAALKIERVRAIRMSP
jgi:hypothetical protein